MKPLSRDPLYLGRGRKRIVHAVGAGLWLSGVVWLGLHYFARQQTEFGPAPHAAEHWVLAAHGLFAFAGLWTFGMLWSGHIVAAWKTGRHRLSGVATASTMLVLIVTGYLLYYAGGDETRPVLSALHWAIGLVLPATYLWHRCAKDRRRKLPRGP